MATQARGRRRYSLVSDRSSSSSSPERVLDDDDSVMVHDNDSQSSIGVSLEEMELDSFEYEEQCRMSPISKLPPELLISVFSKLSTPSDIRNCMLVCKAWARNAVDLLWHRPSTNSWKNFLSVIQTARNGNAFFAYQDLIKRLNLAQLGDLVSDGTLLMLAKCKRIERLTLTDCSKLTDASLPRLIANNRSLLAIDVSGLDQITDETVKVIAEYCYRLQGLNMSKCRGISDESLVRVAERCRRVKRVKFNECTQLTDYSIMAFADHCHDILEIDLHKCANLTDMSVTAMLHQARQLRELRLAHCSQITDNAFLNLPHEQRFDALRILDLTDCNEIGDAGLQKIIDAAPRLRNLVLAKCRNITDRGVVQITRLGKNLHYIHLGHCANITDYGVTQLVRACNRIRYIDLACCTNLTDDSVRLLAWLPKLKRIGLVKCANITDLSIKSLSRPKLSVSGGAPYPNSLERIHLSYCTNLTINGIRQMLVNCPRLTHLSLTGVAEFLREDLLSFCREAPSEFSEHQRDVFCVFSGPGVTRLRAHLKENYPSPSHSDAESDDGSTSIPYAPQQGLFGATQPADTALHAHPQGFENSGPPLALFPSNQLALLQQQLATHVQSRHQAGDAFQPGHQQTPSNTVALPPPPPPPHTSQHFGTAHVGHDGNVVVVGGSQARHYTVPGQGHLQQHHSPPRFEPHSGPQEPNFNNHPGASEAVGGDTDDADADEELGDDSEIPDQD